MKLGAFSVSLTVKDITKSRAFYEKLGFSVFGGEQEQGWLILKNENTVIGLFQGMFDKNLMTFNPGWNQDAENLSEFDDVRDIQKSLKEAGLEPEGEIEEKSGPGSFTITDPDGNIILFDQHL